MSETHYRLPLHIDSAELEFDIFGVSDITCRCVGQFDFLE